MGTALTKAETNRQLQGFLESKKVKDQMMLALPRHMNPDRMVRVALTAILKTPKLQEVAPASLASALVECSQIGLEPNGRDCHLVPFRNNKANRMDVQVIPDYKGMVKLAYRSKMVDSCIAMAVHEGDKFEYQFGSGQFVKHIPCNDENPGPLTHAWAMAKIKDGGEVFVVLNKADIMRHKASSQSAKHNSGPWADHPAAMWAKTAFKELAKWIPQSAEMEAVLQHEHELDYSSGRDILDVESTPYAHSSRADAMADELGEDVPVEKPRPQKRLPKPKPAEAPPKPKPAEEAPEPPPEPPEEAADPADTGAPSASEMRFHEAANYLKGLTDPEKVNEAVAAFKKDMLLTGAHLKKLAEIGATVVKVLARPEEEEGE